MKTSLRILPAMVLALLMAGAAQAIPLFDLLKNGGSITAGDKLFDQWTHTYASSDPLRVFNANNIDVTALNDGGLNPGPGLRFTVTGGELGVVGDDVYAYVDLMLGFHVTVLDPSLKIKDNSLKITGNQYSFLDVNDKDVGLYVHEDAGQSAGADDLSKLTAEYSAGIDLITGLPVSTSKLSDSANFAPQSEIWVTKNILVWAVDRTDSASLTEFEQRFSQIAVPEPAASALLGLAFAGAMLPAALRGRRRLA